RPRRLRSAERPQRRPCDLAWATAIACDAAPPRGSIDAREAVAKRAARQIGPQPVELNASSGEPAQRQDHGEQRRQREGPAEGERQERGARHMAPGHAAGRRPRALDGGAGRATELPERGLARRALVAPGLARNALSWELDEVLH